MSTQFGWWSFDGRRTLSPGALHELQARLTQFGPDDTGRYSRAGVDILYRAFHTTSESRRETQPYVSQSDVVITWDGRLDNRAELLGQFDGELASSVPDVAIVAQAYQRWGTHCFAKLIGDWAVSLWNAPKRSLILAKDPIGVRHLYHSLGEDHVAWGTNLDTLVRNGGGSLQLEEEYIAGWLSHLPAAHLTPYRGVQSVPPSCFVRIEVTGQTITKYWDFDPDKTIRYRTDREYEEHFRAVFAESVRRRLRCDRPVLAELSGGMDSSSIVCVADRVMQSGLVETPGFGTVSYYDDSEPSWNERPFFTKIEDCRGRRGLHIDVSSHEAFRAELESNAFIPTPASLRRPTGASTQFTNHLKEHGYRVLLSGTGGDEVTGGVPTPLPELADLLTRGKLLQLARQLKTWSLNRRKPWIHLLLEAVGRFLPSGVLTNRSHTAPAPWLSPRFIARHPAPFRGYEKRLKLFGRLPSFQENLNVVEAIRRQLACTEPASLPPYEKYYPYLDRSLLEFLFAIPREQLVRPGQRRSLVRRALVGIVPPEVLGRRTKAFVSRAPMIALLTERPALMEMAQSMISDSLGFITARLFVEALERAHRTEEIPAGLFLRTVALESWLRALVRSHLVSLDGSGTDVQPSSTVLLTNRDGVGASVPISVPSGSPRAEIYFNKKGGEHHEIRKA